MGRSKLEQVKDRNEFGQHSNRNSETNSPREDNQESHFIPAPERIPENDAE